MLRQVLCNGDHGFRISSFPEFYDSIAEKDGINKKFNSGRGYVTLSRMPLWVD